MRVRGRNIFAKYKNLLLLGARFYGLFPVNTRLKIWNHISDKKGNLRIAQRYMLLKTLAKSVGDNVSIHDHVYLFHIENMSFGNNVSVHPMCYFQGAGSIEIGDDVSIAHDVTLMTENHGFDNITTPIKDQPISVAPIIIESNVWIGAKAVVLSGRRIKTGSVIGAGAVVTKDIDSNSVVGGVPTHLIKTRDMSL